MLASVWMRKDNRISVLVPGAGLISNESTTNNNQQKLASPKNLPRVGVFSDKMLDEDKTQ